MEINLGAARIWSAKDVMHDINAVLRSHWYISWLTQHGPSNPDLYPHYRGLASFRKH